MSEVDGVKKERTRINILENVYFHTSKSAQIITWKNKNKNHNGQNLASGQHCDTSWIGPKIPVWYLRILPSLEVLSDSLHICRTPVAFSTLKFYLISAATRVRASFSLPCWVPSHYLLPGDSHMTSCNLTWWVLGLKYRRKYYQRNVSKALQSLMRITNLLFYLWHQIYISYLLTWGHTNLSNPMGRRWSLRSILTVIFFPSLLS